jgi:hypothetical protein
MSNIIEATDPLGRRVVCTEENWKGHVLFVHPFMERRKKEIVEAIEEPNIITMDADFPNRDCYYYLITESYLKVVAEFRGNEGEIVTSFISNPPKAGEKVKWMRLSRA